MHQVLTAATTGKPDRRQHGYMHGRIDCWHAVSIQAHKLNRNSSMLSELPSDYSCIRSSGERMLVTICQILMSLLFQNKLIHFQVLNAPSLPTYEWADQLAENSPLLTMSV